MKATRTLYDDFLQHDSSAREGTHLSDIIKFILRTRDPDTYDKPVDDDTRRLWELGSVVEEAISDAFARRYEKESKSCLLQHQVERDGVRMTLDVFNLKRWLVREYKYTNMSANRDVRDLKMRHYLWQIMGYCYAVETLEAELVVIHANGAYGDIRPTTPFRWTLKFKPHELVNNWRMILANKRRMEAA